MAAREKERLQPSLLDRLLDDAPQQRSEPPEQRYLTKARLRQAVIRDLAWLLNAIAPGVADGSPLVRDSVLGYGLPPMAGATVSRIDLGDLEEAVRRAIVSFEPRIVADTVEVRAIRSESVLDSHNLIDFEIRGMLWAQPMPLELLLRTTFDLESGLVDVQDSLAPRQRALLEE